MANIKLRDENGAYITYSNIDTIKLHNAEGTGFTTFTEGDGNRITVSEIEPTAEEGQIGDIWVLTN